MIFSGLKKQQGKKEVSGNFWAFLVAQTIKNLPAMEETQFNSWVGKILWRRKWQPTVVFLPGESPMDRGTWQATVHGGHKESDTTEHTHALKA